MRVAKDALHASFKEDDNWKLEAIRLKGVIEDNIQRLREACGWSKDCTMTTSDVCREILILRDKSGKIV